MGQGKLSVPFILHLFFQLIKIIILWKLKMSSYIADKNYFFIIVNGNFSPKLYKKIAVRHCQILLSLSAEKKSAITGTLLDIKKSHKITDDISYT